MLWSLIKIILFVAVVAALAWGGVFLLESRGGIQVTLMGVEYNFGPLQSVIGIAVLMVAVWVLLKLFTLLVATWKFLNGDETALSRYFDRNRERKGFDALSEGLMALASGEGKLALAKAAKADKYLQKPALTNLLTAQAAEMAGDKRKAEETYRKLVEDETTRFVGVRGIMKQKLADGDTDTALKLAEKAFALKPKHVETGDVLLQLQAGKEDWTGARKTLSAKLKNGQLPRDVHKRRDAVLALSEAKDIIDDGKDIEAREVAIEANRLSPDLIPAAVMAAQGYIAEGKPRYATRVLTKAWSVQPHPDLAATFAAIEPEEKPAARIKRFKALTKLQPDHAETKMLLAELHIADEDFPAARRALGNLVETDPTARSVTLMAAVERGEGASDTVVKGWLARALTVSRGPQWICDNCQNIHSEWAPTCGNCQSFDTLTWKTPPMAEVAMPGGVSMLPLIVGGGDDNTGSDGAVVVSAAIEDAELITDPPEDGSAQDIPAKP
ncbi:heme biosynthesis protein HemY [Sulfitobacter sp. M57]|uniref:heme biosynthesis protein HemY n=1 Tax=unclassified Sulfitobacter TaxID=196795 RepID=UPI0023E2F283|nr:MULTISPECIES: heme biosynthesis HemY N-terminal domain-containing protein [unclassified Sulfitobacter]MDF3415037.1 heme biosynthesis protein HemY [Sulfitobacter sp. KE5]MDF3422518.1 heme biosynthesis protein HemY [Sulfitobacter sp. KE43]MDF3433583.1 heme biosynthesis protein HemY [Sulfitobacter sp. KE42]MDF3459223.1 heme biosynthesis protein HemY [Sulfitobacter sp. S74]MDF3463122.1 heme biosynthesis protein HemY [Sulfitobacter sp. Ks18]